MKVGILGGGQLGQMLAEAARPLEVETLVLDPAADAVAGRVTRHLAADWTDAAALAELAATDVVTYEFENVPAEAVEKLVADVPVHPLPEALVKSGDRIVEKALFGELGIETAPFAQVDSREDLDRAVAEIGLPAIIRPAFTLGGTGGGVAYNRAEYEHYCRTGMDASPVGQILVDESLLGWKEVEYEV